MTLQKSQHDTLSESVLMGLRGREKKNSATKIDFPK